VVAPRTEEVADGPVPLVFGRVFGTDAVPMSRHAIAWSQGTTGAGIIVLASEPQMYPGWNYATGLLVGGGAEIDLRGENEVGDIQVNATSEEMPWAAFRLSGTSAEIWAGEFNVVGTSNPDADDTVAWSALYADGSSGFSVNSYASNVNDPLRDLDPPTFDTADILFDANGNPYTYTIDNKVVQDQGLPDPNAGIYSLTLQPGYYPGGISLTKSGVEVVLVGGEDAVYALGGGTDGKSGLVINGGRIIGEGVMIYVTGDPDGTKTGTQCAYGKIDIDGNSYVRIVSRADQFHLDPNDELGIAIWQDRDNHNPGKIIGTGDCEIVGTIYCGYNAMEVGGNAQQMGNQLIAGCLYLHGRVSLGIAYDGRNKVLAYRSILVE
jgi:hypothetical protein